MGKDVDKEIKEKTVCEDGVNVLHTSEVRMKFKQPEENCETHGYDGPLQMAPEPTKFLSDENKVQEPPLRPQRHWEPEQVANQNQNFVSNNWPAQHQGNPMVYTLPYDRSSLPYRQNDGENRPIRQNQKCVEKTSYHISSTGEDGEEMIEENSIIEDGFQIYHSSAYKKKMKRLEKLEKKNVEELESMKRQISTRFLLTKAKPSMSEEAVEQYILKNFDVDFVYVRKNPMKFENYSSFIFIINSDEELNIRDFEHHAWPGLLKCFFAPNSKNKGY